MRYQNLPGLAAFSDAGREIDRIAKQVVTAAESGAIVNAGSDAKAFVPGSTLVLQPKLSLNGDGRTHGEARFWELGHDRIANLLDDDSMKFFNGTRYQTVVAVEQQKTGGIAEAIEIRRRTNDVG